MKAFFGFVLLLAGALVGWRYVPMNGRAVIVRHAAKWIFPLVIALAVAIFFLVLAISTQTKVI